MSFIYSIFEQLASDNSRLAKEAILIKNKSNGTLQRVFYLALDPFQQFYIRKSFKFFKPICSISKTKKKF